MCKELCWLCVVFYSRGQLNPTHLRWFEPDSMNANWAPGLDAKRKVLDGKVCRPQSWICAEFGPFSFSIAEAKALFVVVFCLLLLFTKTLFMLIFWKLSWKEFRLNRFFVFVFPVPWFLYEIIKIWFLRPFSGLFQCCKMYWCHTVFMCFSSSPYW